MCGIAGIYHRDRSDRIDEGVLRRMNNTLSHRGPDAEGYFVSGNIGLGHRRLSIIDLQNGQQPFFSVDGNVVVTFNGEIYNYKEIRSQLQAVGYQFLTNSDTEVLVYGWQHWRTALPTVLRGMFAFAIWDKAAQELFLARDRLGIKPIYYSLVNGDTFLFGSELKALLVHPQLPRALNHESIEDYFAFGYIPEPKTILQAARRLPAGHQLHLNADTFRDRPAAFWNVSFDGSGAAVEENEALEQLRTRVDEAVAIRLMSDVPFGALLSGGVDSSSVVASMARQMSEPVKTFSISFADPAFNEAVYARRVAESYRTEHKQRVVEIDDSKLLPRLAQVFDEPFADISSLPTYRVCELAASAVKVALSGDGGDEVFAGYPYYSSHVRKAKLRSLLPNPIRRRVLGPLGRIYPQTNKLPRFLQAKSLLETLAMDPVGSFARSATMTTEAVRHRLFSNSFRGALQGYDATEVVRTVARDAPTDSPLGLAQYIDMKLYLASDILTKVDRTSMAHSLEVRVPLLDHKLVEWSAGLPSKLHLRGSTGKYLLKKAMSPRLPHDLMYRRKVGFDIPVDDWFRGDLRNALRASVERLHKNTNMFDMSGLSHLLMLHENRSVNFGALFWAVVVFDLCMQNLSPSAGI